MVELKNADRKDYERTFIAYYLPGMKVDAGAWATTHFNPDLKIFILGLTTEEEEILVSEPHTASREVIGKWLTENAFAGGLVTIYRENGMPYMEVKFKDGSSLNEQLVEKSSSHGQRFENAERLSLKEHYLIDRQGNLQIRDQEGLIDTGKRIY